MQGKESLLYGRLSLIRLLGKVVYVKSRTKTYVDKLVALKSLALNLSNTLHEFTIHQYRLLPDLSYTFSQYVMACFMTAIRHEGNNLESSVVVQELYRTRIVRESDYSPAAVLCMQ